MAAPIPPAADCADSAAQALLPAWREAWRRQPWLAASLLALLLAMLALSVLPQKPVTAFDDETLFYFESRGIGKAEAENILARAAIERLARETGDEETEKLIIKILDEDL